MKIKRDDLQGALEKVKPGLADKEIIEQATYFAFMGEKVVTYNAELSISHPVPGLEDFTGAIKAEELYKFLTKTSAESIEIELGGEFIRLKAGKATVKFALQKEVKLPLEEVEKIGKWKPIPKEFLSALKEIIFSCSKDMSRPLLTCANILNDGTIESSDNFRATRYQIDKMPVGSFLLPATSAQELVKYEVTEICTGKEKDFSWVHFRTGDGTIISCIVWADEYPNIVNKMLEDKGKKNKIQFPDTVPAILERAAIFAKREQRTDEFVEVRVDNRKLTISAKSAFGQFEEWVKVEYAGEPFLFSLNPTLLSDMLKVAKECKVSPTRIIMEGKNWSHVCILEEERV